MFMNILNYTNRRKIISTSIKYQNNKSNSLLKVTDTYIDLGDNLDKHTLIILMKKL